MFLAMMPDSRADIVGKHGMTRKQGIDFIALKIENVIDCCQVTCRYQPVADAQDQMAQAYIELRLLLPSSLAQADGPLCCREQSLQLPRTAERQPTQKSVRR